MREIEKIALVLSNNAEDWEPRTDGLIKIQRLTYGGVTQYPIWNSLLTKLREPIVIQVREREREFLNGLFLTILSSYLTCAHLL